MPKRKSSFIHEALPRRQRVARTQIVLVDGSQWRDATKTDCAKLLQQIEKNREEWRRFEAEDQPDFAAWMATNFGALQTSLRETGNILAERATLIREVEDEMDYSCGSARSAYKAVMKRREAPEPEPADDFHDDPGPPPPPLETEEVDEAMFGRFLKEVLGMRASDLDRKTYASMYRQFKAMMLGTDDGGLPEDPPPRTSRERPAPQAEAERRSAETSRLKEIYRILVRRLHPDARAKGSAVASTLWHDVQDAYTTGNLERLEMLLAMTDLHEQRDGDHTTLGQMKAVLKELRRSLGAIQRSLARARKDPAWRFSVLLDREPLRVTILRALKEQLRSQEDDIRAMDAVLGQWSAQRRSSKKGKPKRKRAEAELF